MSAEKSVAWPRRFQMSKPVKSLICFAAAIRWIRYWSAKGGSSKFR